MPVSAKNAKRVHKLTLTEKIQKLRSEMEKHPFKRKYYESKIKRLYWLRNKNINTLH